MKFFVSSTYNDLKVYRRIAIDMINDITKGMTGSSEQMENFSATENTCKDECLQRLAASDVVIGIYGDRYGSIADDEDISMTELEFDKAVEQGKIILAFVSYSDCRDAEEERFIKEKVFKRGKSCGRFRSENEFASCLNQSLRIYFGNLDGFSYSSIWEKVEKAISDISQKQFPVETFGPRQEEHALQLIIDSVELLPRLHNRIMEYGANANDEYVYIGIPNTYARIKTATYYLRLCFLQNRLLTELWTNELKSEILRALEDYTEFAKSIE